MKPLAWFLIISLFLASCTTLPEYANEPIKYAVPVTPPIMRTYTPEGIEIQWWIFEEFDESCTIEYAVFLKQEQIGKGIMPCQLMNMFFHAIQKRQTA